MSPLDEASVAAFRSRLRGPLFLPKTEGYEEACNIWNAMIKSRPALVVRPTGTADVIECVNFAREKNLPISARGGGHNIAGTALPEGGLTVDLSRLRGVLVDPAAKIAHVQGGCLLGDVDRETQVHGLATALGFVSETGVAGLTLGGGFGYLTRQYGWTVDSLLEVEIITSDGRVRRASLTENPDLFWALRGGGGNFGIVTSFTYKLYPLGPKITAGMIVWPADQAEGVLSLYRDLTSRVPRTLTLALTMRIAPPAPFLPKEAHGKPMIAMVVCHAGSRAEAEKDLAPLKAFGKPLADLIVEKTYVQQQSMLDATQPKGVNYYWKSEYLPALSDAALREFRSRGASVTSPQSQIVMFHVGGAIADRKADDGAVGNRDALYMLGIAGSWLPADAQADKHLEWVRESWKAMRPYSTGGVYINFLTEEEGEDRVRESYKDNFDRLSKVKKTFDPANLFRSNKNISPLHA